MPQTARRARLWPTVVLVLVVIGLAGAWTLFWNYAVAQAETAIAGWLDREARLGRTYSCSSQTIGGFPFRIEVRCDNAAAQLRNVQPELSLKLKDVRIVAQIYQPTLFITEFTGPLMVAEPGQVQSFAADWTLAQASVRGLPTSPERVSVVFDGPKLERVGGARETLFAA